MNQRPPTFPVAHYTPQSYAYAQSTYTARQQPQQQFPPNVQYSIHSQQTPPTYFSSLPPTTAINAQNGQALQHLHQSSSNTRQNAVARSKTPPATNAGAIANQTQESPEVTQYDGDVSMSFQQDDDTEEPSGEVYQLPPPPEHTYASDKDLEKEMHAWCLDHGYELVRRASKKNSKGVLYKRYYHCSKHGKMANTGKLTDETRVRVNRKSNRIGCPMSIAGVAVDPSNPSGQWQIRHRKIHHNHGPMEAVALAGHRRRARMGGVEKAVDGLFAIGTATAQVLTFLQRTNPSGLFTRTDVANMKLKFKKHGTCVDRRDADQTDNPRATVACFGCREKKVRCDSTRPTCAVCLQTGRDCAYPPTEEDNELQSLPDIGTAVRHETAPSQQPPRQAPPSRRSSVPLQEPSRAQDILADLEAFKADHVRPVKLSLSSSLVEVLAASSCGSGASYSAIPTLDNTDQWEVFRNAVVDASMKENTSEVLMGQKTEPSKPHDEGNIEEWNEYVRQLAIFNRRNTALLGALLPKLSSQYRSLVQHLQKAAEIWQVLEQMCHPRGADKAYKLYLDLHDITLQTSASLRVYITKLEAAWTALNRVTCNPEERSTPYRSLKDISTFSEDMLCFLFLRNLGPAFSAWAENICRMSSVGGFGSRRRVGYADLTRSALDWEAMQRSTSR